VSGNGWPSPEAAARLDRLWPGGHIDAEGYLAISGRAPLAVWAAQGPVSELIVGQDERAMQYYLGLADYILAAHGPSGLREVIRQCAGTTVADFVYTYKQTVAHWAESGPLSLRPGCYDPGSAKLATAPPAADLSPGPMTLAPGDSVCYPVFLPTGRWQLAVQAPQGAPGGRLLVSFDGGQEAEAIVGPEAKPLPVGPLTESWHKVTLRAPAEQAPLQIARLALQSG
jgi:hypothetical protein